MERCRDCNSVLLRTEKVCGQCGNQVEKCSHGGLREKFTTIVSMALYISLGVTAATLFMPDLPPLSKCLPVSLVLLMIRSSADQMTDTSK